MFFRSMTLAIKICALLAMFAAMPAGVVAQTVEEAPAKQAPVAARQAIPRSGLTILWGGGEIPATLWERFAEAAASGKPTVVVSESLAKELEPRIAMIREKNPAISIIAGDAKELASELAKRDAVWIDTSSLGSDAMPLDQTLVSSEFVSEVTPPDSICEQLVQLPGLLGLGVPRAAGIIFKGREMEIVGAAKVGVCLPASVSAPTARPLDCKLLKRGDRADLIALSRAAIDRLGERFPPEKPETPNVPHGALLACGGGVMTEDVWRRFIELAGGVDAPIVVLPIAMPDPDDPNPKGVGALRKFGCTDITVLNQHTKVTVQTPQFIAALKRAKGVWFAGGRQWKYVDAYEGTVAEALFRSVLERGGVIAGSSAGAAIQAQYMVRGNPLGNQNIMAEGYERGLNLLPGAAIDIHVTERRRLPEMEELVRAFPQILGIALDEGVAIEIQGHTFRVLGIGKARIVEADRAEPLVLKPGERFDMRDRKPLE